MSESDDADTTLVEEIDELHETSDLDNHNSTIIDIMNDPNTSNQDYQVRLTVTHDHLSRFSPSRVAPWIQLFAHTNMQIFRIKQPCRQLCRR